MTAAITDDDYAALMAPFGLGPRAPLAVAVSGGPDSMALLVLAAREAEASGREVTALTVDHRLRPEAAGEARAVAVWAQALGVRHEVLAWDGHKPASDIQAAARRARYALMGAWCAANGIGELLVAHTQDDQAETLLMRLGRGSGVDGLAAMGPESFREGVRLLRPLLTVPRARLIATLEAAGQAHVVDPSNEDTRHARVRMRALMPALADEGLTAPRLAATTRAMARAREALGFYTCEHLSRAARIDRSGFAVADARMLLDAPDEIVLRALSRLVMAIGGATYPPRYEQIERLRARLEDGGFKGATLGGVRIAPRSAGLLFVREARAAEAANPATVPGSGGAAVWDGRFEVSLRPGADDGVLVRALGPKGWRDLKDGAGAMPPAAGPALPALYVGDKLAEVPHLGYCAHAGGPMGVARFVGPRRAGLESLVADVD